MEKTTKNDKALELGMLLKNYRDNIFIRVYFLAQFITRIILCISAFRNEEILAANIPSILIIGFVADIITSSFFLPIIVMFQRMRYFKLVGHLAFSTLIILTMFVQLIFWYDFKSNLNFIAVDFFVYNPKLQFSIFEKFYLSVSILIFCISTIFLTFITYKFSNKQKPNLKLALGGFIVAITIGKFYNSELFGPVENKYAHELSKNGIYEFTYAYLKNSPNYQKYYLYKGSDIALKNMRSNLSDKNSFFVGQKNLFRKITSTENMIKKNVVIILLEDFSYAENTATNIENIAKESMLFTNIYATGTDRSSGIEALTMSIPPLPGNSVIKRDNNRNLFNASTIFRDNNYVNDFIYGGYSVFNNLQNFLIGNNFIVLDRGSFSSDDISYKNIWNISDEDVFKKAIKKYDIRQQKNKNFFSIILTSSKNLSKDFLANKIDMKDQENSRIKYIDYAIGNFIEEAKTKEWFKDTIFVITSTNAPSSKDQNELNKENYHIPLMIYAPGFIEASVNNKLGSQIDIAPTILGLLNFDYDSKFFGQDLIKHNPQRAFITTNIVLGYLNNNSLTNLLPYHNAVNYRIENNEKILTEKNQLLINEAITYYQTSYDLFSQNQMKEGL